MIFWLSIFKGGITVSTVYDVKRVYVVVRDLAQTASIAREFGTRLDSLCKAAEIPSLGQSWIGVDESAELSVAAQRQFFELCSWLRKRFPTHKYQFRH